MSNEIVPLCPLSRSQRDCRRVHLDMVYKVMMNIVLRVGVAATVLLVVAGCAPSISPLYRDYDVGSNGNDVRERIHDALAATRWDVVETDTPHVISTDTVTIRRWGLYSVEVALEVAPIGDNYVRVFIHPYRHYFTGTRRKMPYFKKRLRRTILPKLQEAFEAQGLIAIGSSRERDKKSRAG